MAGGPIVETSLLLDEEGWKALTVAPGNVLEVELGTSSLRQGMDTWGSFLVADSYVKEDGTLMVIGRFLAAEDKSLDAVIRDGYDVASVMLHLCHRDPDCPSSPNDRMVLHVVQARLWAYADFVAIAELSPPVLAQAESWVRELVDAIMPGGVGGRKPAKRPTGKEAAKPPRGSKKPKEAAAPKTPRPRRDQKAPKVDKGDTEVAAGDTRKLTEEMKEKLRSRLGALRRGTEEGAEGGATSVEAAELDGEPLDSSSEDNSDFVEDVKKGLESGTHLPDPGRELATAALSRKRKKGGDPFLQAALEDTRGDTSKDLKSPLLRQALACAQDRAAQKKKEKKSKEGKNSKAIEDLSKALTSLLQPAMGRSGQKKKKDKKKDKKDDKKSCKKKRRLTADGVIVSSSGSSRSSSTSREVEVNESDSDLETPFKKKSRESPGSVMSMLTNHVRETLEQSATVEVASKGQSLTSGVKVLTYFALHLKPNFGNYIRELRELHHLAACLDTLRRGDLARTGDALAARFMAIHQSLIDQNWYTARHMELHPMEDSTAAASSMVLATRRHAKLVQKVQGVATTQAWAGKGRAKGQGGWYPQSENKGEGKTEKGKGKKGRGKGKYKGYPAEWTPGRTDWKEKQEKPKEKES